MASVLLLLALGAQLARAGAAERDDYSPRDTDRAPDVPTPAAAANSDVGGVLLHQMLSGREVAKSDQRATQMKNFQ